ncbi:MAG TPA: hypothetical protein V6C52_02425 [Coleofasciculaceae cyanobacterium]|jgi:hypothetical protein
MQTGIPSSNQRANSLRFSGSINGVEGPPNVVFDLLAAAKAGRDTDIFVARNAEENGMDVVVKSPASNNRAESTVAQIEDDFETLVTVYNAADMYDDQIRIQAKSPEVPDSETMEARGYMPLETAKKNPDLFPGRLAKQSLSELKSTKPDASSQEEAPKQEIHNRKSRMKKRQNLFARKMKSLLQKFSAITGWDNNVEDTNLSHSKK